MMIQQIEVRAIRIIRFYYRVTAQANKSVLKTFNTEIITSHIHNVYRRHFNFNIDFVGWEFEELLSILRTTSTSLNA